MNLAHRITFARIAQIPLFSSYVELNVSAGRLQETWTSMSYVLTVYVFLLAAWNGYARDHVLWL
ncbi:hypothetical protein [Paenibacillus sp. Marseille-Q4541]|uniref:hypothetical protein n=1 Tax=Paenibacillus sp. Marseille-Q4541 TaxID=2831522 RepID=UPI001BA6A8AF|nr:hypothetical protein [Paenibacillus sp. Marseille-Q4541]